MDLRGLRQRLARIGVAAAPPEIRLPPHLLASAKAAALRRWPLMSESDWRRHLRTIDRVLHMNSEERATLLSDLDARATRN